MKDITTENANNFRQKIKKIDEIVKKITKEDIYESIDKIEEYDRNNITTEEATKIIKNFIDYFNKNKDDGNKANLCVLGEEIKAIEKVLNELNSKKGTINALKIALKERTDERDKKDEIINKKDKIIDAMALQLSGLSVWDSKKDEPVLLGTEEEVKQYFEKQVKDGWFR